MVKPVFRYASRRAKNARVRRNTGLILLFAGIILLVFAIFHRLELLAYLRTYTY